jgi:branched-chain amino acid transport system substrate-binding protein
MRDSAKLAFQEASDSGALLGGETITVLVGDSTCIDSAAAQSVAEGQVSQGVAAIMGADCSGVTGAIASNVAVPNGVVMISPSATSPGLTTLDDKGLFFRTAPSDARGGQILADITKDRGIKSVAITYTNNDYGKGLADVYEAAVKAHGISVTVVAAHEDGKADYSAEVGVLASAGGDAVAVIGYLDQGGKGIIQGSIDSGAFDTFILSDGMIGNSLTDAFGKSLNKSFGSLPGSTGKGAGIFTKVASAAGIDSSGPYTGESYDAAALIVLAIQAGGSADRASIAKNVMAVANGPGKKIYPGQLKKGLDLLAKGKAIDYEGATGVTFTDVGEAVGSFLEKEIKYGKFKTKKQR